MRRRSCFVLLLGLFSILVLVPLSASAEDTDDDRLPDWWEQRHGFSLDSRNTWGDPDGDRLPNLKEFRSRTSPRREDSDWDGIDDGDEVLDLLSDPRDSDENENGKADGNDGETRRKPQRRIGTTS
jgi:hypothetical protein